MSVSPSKAGFLAWLRDRAAAGDDTFDFERLVELAATAPGARAVDRLVLWRAVDLAAWGVGDPVQWRRAAWEESSLPSELKDRIEEVGRRGTVQGFAGPLTFVAFPAAPGQKHGAVLGLQLQAIQAEREMD